jgi:hypothetical protein
MSDALRQSLTISIELLERLQKEFGWMMGPEGWDEFMVDVRETVNSIKAEPAIDERQTLDLTKLDLSPPPKTLRIFADPCLFDGSTWGHVATIEELTEVITRALTENVITQSETLNIRFRYLSDEEVENLTSI